MVIKCTHCKGLMQVDETRIPKGGGVKVRCPRCKEIGYVPAPSLSAQSAQGPMTGTAGVSPPQVPLPGTAPRRTPSETTHGMRRDEPAFPEDAFENFRFPAENAGNALKRRPMSTRKKIIIVVAVSLAVVAVFALLVNIVLPGPSGRRPFSGGVRPAPTSQPSRATGSDPVHDQRPYSRSVPR